MTGTCGSRVARTTQLVVTGLLLAWAAAGCASPTAVAGGSATACYQVTVRAIQRHVTLPTVPAACQGLSQAEVNVAVSRALRAAAAGVHGKVRQREVIARDSAYVAQLIRAVPASSPPTAVASPSPPPGGPAVAPSPTSSRAGLRLAALAAWLVTVGLGLTMMARWIVRGRRPRRGAPLNFAHFGLALTGLLVWISYLATGAVGLAWAGCGLLLAVASLGITLVFLGPAAVTTAADLPAEPLRAGHRPVFVIAAHVIAACVTILLVTLAAIGAG